MLGKISFSTVQNQPRFRVSQFVFFFFYFFDIFSPQVRVLYVIHFFLTILLTGNTLNMTRRYCSMIVPGSGEPNFDTFEANPFETSKQRREAEVVALLEKLSPETIGLDPSFVGRVDSDPAALQKEQARSRKFLCLDVV